LLEKFNSISGVWLTGTFILLFMLNNIGGQKGDLNVAQLEQQQYGGVC